jgi:5-methylcytosine-specific restriction endonuclease McrA
MNLHIRRSLNHARREPNPSRAFPLVAGATMAKLKLLKPGLRAMDPRTVRPPAKTADPFYYSAEWIELRDRVRREAGGICQRPGCDRHGYIVDHIVEIRDDPSRKLDRSNLELLCQGHHVEKTNRERARRAARSHHPLHGGGRSDL